MNNISNLDLLVTELFNFFSRLNKQENLKYNKDIEHLIKMICIVYGIDYYSTLAKYSL